MFRSLARARPLITISGSTEGADKIANSFTARAVATTFRDSFVSDNTQLQRVPSRRA
jgi:nicotinamide mononucleotide adenylyltransferase